jgi:hypothetical protein
MKNHLKMVLVSGGLAVALGVGFFAGQAVADQPHMQAALDALRTSRGELVAAKDNKGGHRLKALGYVDQAMAEVKAGIAFAN